MIEGDIFYENFKHRKDQVHDREHKIPLTLAIVYIHYYSMPGILSDVRNKHGQAVVLIRYLIIYQAWSILLDNL